jgi:hypothetical protein
VRLTNAHILKSKPKYMNIQNLIKAANQNNFQDYLDCPHPDKVEYKNINCLIMTCLDGDYDGEVIDALYNYTTGKIVSLSVYSQFLGVKSKFKLNK